MRAIIERHLRECQEAAEEAKKAMIANLGAVNVCTQILKDLDTELAGVKTPPVPALGAALDPEK